MQVLASSVLLLLDDVETAILVGDLRLRELVHAEDDPRALDEREERGEHKLQECPAGTAGQVLDLVLVHVRLQAGQVQRHERRVDQVGQEGDPERRAVAHEEVEERVESRKRREGPEDGVDEDARSPPELNRGTERDLHQTVVPASALTEEVLDALSRLLFKVPLDPSRAMAALHELESPEGVLGDASFGSKIEPDQLLDIVANNDVAAVQSEDGAAEAVLEVEASEVIPRTHVVSERHDGMLLPRAVVQDGSLSDAQLTRCLFFADHLGDPLDTRGRRLGLLVEVNQPSVVRDVRMLEGIMQPASLVLRVASRRLVVIRNRENLDLRVVLQRADGFDVVDNHLDEVVKQRCRLHLDDASLDGLADHADVIALAADSEHHELLDRLNVVEVLRMLVGQHAQEPQERGRNGHDPEDRAVGSHRAPEVTRGRQRGGRPNEGLDREQRERDDAHAEHDSCAMPRDEPEGPVTTRFCKVKPVSAVTRARTQIDDRLLPRRMNGQLVPFRLEEVYRRSPVNRYR